MATNNIKEKHKTLNNLTNETRLKFVLINKIKLVFQLKFTKHTHTLAHIERKS